MTNLLNAILVLVMTLNLAALGVGRIEDIIRIVALQGALLALLPLLAHDPASAAAGAAALSAAVLAAPAAARNNSSSTSDGTGLVYPRFLTAIGLCLPLALLDRDNGGRMPAVTAGGCSEAQDSRYRPVKRRFAVFTLWSPTCLR